MINAPQNLTIDGRKVIISPAGLPSLYIQVQWQNIFNYILLLSGWKCIKPLLFLSHCSDAIGRIRVLSVKTALSTLCAGRLVDKLRCK